MSKKTKREDDYVKSDSDPDVEDEDKTTSKKPPPPPTKKQAPPPSRPPVKKKQRKRKNSDSESSDSESVVRKRKQKPKSAATAATAASVATTATPTPNNKIPENKSKKDHVDSGVAEATVMAMAPLVPPPLSSPLPVALPPPPLKVMPTATVDPPTPPALSTTTTTLKPVQPPTIGAVSGFVVSMTDEPSTPTAAPLSLSLPLPHLQPPSLMQSSPPAHLPAAATATTSLFTSRSLGEHTLSRSITPTSSLLSMPTSAMSTAHFPSLAHASQHIPPRLSSSALTPALPPTSMPFQTTRSTTTNVSSPMWSKPPMASAFSVTASAAATSTHPSAVSTASASAMVSLSYASSVYAAPLPPVLPDGDTTLDVLQKRRTLSSSSSTVIDMDVDILSLLEDLYQCPRDKNRLHFPMPLTLTRDKIPPPVHSSAVNRTDFLRNLISPKLNGDRIESYFSCRQGQVVWKAFTREKTRYRSALFTRLSEHLSRLCTTSHAAMVPMFEGKTVFSSECMQLNDKTIVLFVFDMPMAVDQNLTTNTFLRRWSIMVHFVTEWNRHLSAIHLSDKGGENVHLIWKPFYDVQHMPILFARMKPTKLKWERMWGLEPETDRSSIPVAFQPGSILNCPGRDLSSDGVVFQKPRAGLLDKDQLDKFRWYHPADVAIPLTYAQHPRNTYPLYVHVPSERFHNHNGGGSGGNGNGGERKKDNPQRHLVPWGDGVPMDDSVVQQIQTYASRQPQPPCIVVECLPSEDSTTLQICHVRDPNEKCVTNSLKMIGTTQLLWIHPVTEHDLLSCKFRY